MFTEVAAEMAATHPEVRRFRSGELGGRLLTREEAGEALFGKGDLRNELGEDPLPSLAKQLAKHYHWRDYDAAWFVLTGDAPPVRLLLAGRSQIHSAEMTTIRTRRGSP